MLFIWYNTFMKKIVVPLLTAVLLLTGCSNSKKLVLETYEMYYQIISENSEYVKDSSYYTLSYEVKKGEHNQYNYYLFLDSPTISMYDVVFMAVENEVSFDSNLQMVPSIGIFDGKYQLVPNQINKDKGFVKGMMISGESSYDKINLKVLVEWKDKTRKKTTREFHHVQLTLDGYSYLENAS